VLFGGSLFGCEGSPGIGSAPDRGEVETENEEETEKRTIEGGRNHETVSPFDSAGINGGGDVDTRVDT
jgi:hypothetical protein